MEKLRELESKVIDWATDRNFFGEGGATLFSQYLKLREEFGELSGNFAKGKCMKDDIGDCAVVVIIMNRLSGNKNIIDSDFIDKLNNLKIEIKDKDEAYCLIDCSVYYIMELSDVFTLNPPIECFRNTIGLLVKFSEHNGYNFTECIEHSYNEIKDRKGEWINNVFVKESDLQ